MKACLLTVITALLLVVASDSYAGARPMLEEENDPSIPGDASIFKRVSLRIDSPKENEVLPSGDFDVTFTLRGYALEGTGPGPHIHVIVDNQPYLADFDSGKPFALKGLSPGSHTIRAFPSRPWHESIKAPHAFAMVRFFVAQKPDAQPYANWPDPKKPLLTYSRPKGNYAGGDSKSVLVDFWVTGTKLSPTGDRVLLSVDGNEQTLTEWKPLHLTNLANGEHTITLDLQDANGRPIDNAFNHTERTFTINMPPGNSPQASAPSQP